MLRALRSIFAWRTVEDTGVHAYQENTVTGRRRVVRYGRGGHQPVDMQWIETGEWYQPPPPGTPIDIGGGTVGVPPSIFPHFSVNVPMPSGTKPPRAYTDADVRALADAMWQLLDDMGRDGLGVCAAAKAQARVAYEPFLQNDLRADPSLTADYAPDMPLAAARAILDEVGL